MTKFIPKALFCLCLVSCFKSGEPAELNAPDDPQGMLCANNFRTRLWAQEAVDADLMAEDRPLFVKNTNPVKVAVIDTGFDLLNSKVHMEAAIETRSASKIAGDLNKDEGGHGTMVAGIIGGKDGVGVAPKAAITVYRMTASSEGTANSSIINNAIKQACDDGHKIINLSWGSLNEESGFGSVDKERPKVIEYLASKGCLMVKSAGNDAYRNQPAGNLDDASLRVAAISHVGTLSSFSSIGEVSAPGTKTFTLKSSQDRFSEHLLNSDRCDDKPGRFVNGTSFASPITAAIAAEVYAVLQDNPKNSFSTLSPPEQVTLMTRILKGAEIEGSISGLRAMGLADLWTKHSSKLLSVEELSLLPQQHQPAFCSESMEPLTATNVESFTKNARRRLALCPLKPEYKHWLGIQMFAASIMSSNVERGYRALRYMDGNATYKTFGNDVKNFWNIVIKRWMKIAVSSEAIASAEFDEFAELFPVLVKTQDTNSAFKAFTVKAIHSWVMSQNFENRISRRDGRGSEDDAVKLTKIWSAFADRGLHDVVIASLEKPAQSISTAKHEYSILFGRKLLSMMRVVDSVFQSTGFDKADAKLRDIEFGMFEQANKTNQIEVVKVAEANPNFLELAYQGDLNNFQVNFLTPFFDRHKEAVWSLTGLDQGQFEPTVLNSFFVLYFLRGGSFTTDERLLVAKSVLTAISQGRGWDAKSNFSEILVHRSNEILARNATIALQNVYLVADESRKNQIKAFYEKLLEESVDIGFYLAAIPDAGSGADNAYFWKKALSENPLITKSLVQNAAIRMTHSIILWSPSFKSDEAEVVMKLFRLALPFLSSEDAVFDSNRQLEVPVLTTPVSNRFEVTSYETRSIPMQPSHGHLLDQVLNDWAKMLVELPEERRNRAFYSFKFFTPVMLDLKACAALPAGGAWRSSLETLLERLKDDNWSKSMVRFEAKNSVERILDKCGQKAS
jgi:hypothetical protein